MLAVLGMIIVGFIAGYVARAVIPGDQKLSVFQTLLLGVVGSFIGGFLGYVIFEKDLENGAFQASGILGSIIGAVIVLFIYSRTGAGRKRFGSPRSQ